MKHLWKRIWWSVVMTKCLGQMDFKKMDLAFFSTPPLAPSALSFQELHHSANLVQMAALEHEPDEVARASHSKESVDSAACTFQGGQHRQFRSFFHAAALSENSNLSASLSQTARWNGMCTKPPEDHLNVWLDTFIHHVFECWEYTSMSMVPATGFCRIQNATLSPCIPHLLPCTSTSLPKFTGDNDFRWKKYRQLNHCVHHPLSVIFSAYTIFTRVPPGEGPIWGVKRLGTFGSQKKPHDLSSLFGTTQRFIDQWATLSQASAVLPSPGAWTVVQD